MVQSGSHEEPRSARPAGLAQYPKGPSDGNYGFSKRTARLAKDLRCPPTNPSNSVALRVGKADDQDGQSPCHTILPVLNARVVLFQHYLELDHRVKNAALQDAVCMRRMTVPCVGPIAALTFKAAVDDPKRFKRSRTVAAHFGLTPSGYQSGEHDNPSRISKTGDQNVRATLYAAANALLMRTMAKSQIKSWGMRLIRSKCRHRAVVAVARKLAVFLHRLWIDGTEFHSLISLRLRRETKHLRWT